MSNPNQNSFEKTAPKAEKTSPEKTDKLWISAALVALLVGFSAPSAQANDGLLGGLGNTVNGLTSSITNTVNDLGGSDASAGLSLASSNDVGVNAGDKSVNAALDADINAAAQKQGEGIGLSGLATEDTAASVNLSGIDQATSAHVTSSGAIVLD